MLPKPFVSRPAIYIVWGNPHVEYSEINTFFRCKIWRQLVDLKFHWLTSVKIDVNPFLPLKIWRQLVDMKIQRLTSVKIEVNTFLPLQNMTSIGWYQIHKLSTWCRRKEILHSLTWSSNDAAKISSQGFVARITNVEFGRYVTLVHEMDWRRPYVKTTTGGELIIVIVSNEYSGGDSKPWLYVLMRGWLYKVFAWEEHYTTD